VPEALPETKAPAESTAVADVDAAGVDGVSEGDGEAAVEPLGVGDGVGVPLPEGVGLGEPEPLGLGFGLVVGLGVGLVAGGVVGATGASGCGFSADGGITGGV